MKNKSQLALEMNNLVSLRDIIEAYEEIAAMRMRKVKKSVLQNRDFISGLNDIYQKVWYTYQNTKKNSQKSDKTTLLTTNGKTLAILVSANTGLYGDIIKKTFNLFIQNNLNSGNDLVILGKIGKQLFDDMHTNNNYKYFEVSDTAQEKDTSKELLEYIIGYTNIIVYHGLYVSVLTQKPVRTFVTGKAVDFKQSDAKQELKCLIEPTVEEVTAFFEKQILTTIFEQSIFEANLSKFASRMISLDVASDNILDQLKEVRFQTLKTKHNINNIKQQERISGIALWK